MSNMRDFSYIGGLDKHIKIVKEMVLFPLIYGDIYAKFNLKPPRGLLFYGLPGTGKTLVASALAVECSNAERKVSFISRKGSDCLSKYVGESEKKLQKIFQLAQQTKPCIIFFDEVDGLAPIRTSRQDFVHASVVSTLLALMDGLDNNSEIIVIGATNRLDAIDPALRRSGRFDRELYFPLPCYSARKDILSIYVKNWKYKPPVKFVSYIAARTVGYCGSDLQALCAEAVMCCVRRQYPQIYTTKTKLNINERCLKVERKDFIEAQINIIPAYYRSTLTPIKKLCTSLFLLHEHNITLILNTIKCICSPEMLPFEKDMEFTMAKSRNCPRLLLCGKDDCHTRHLAPALLHALEHLPLHILDVTTLFEETGRSVEEAIIQKFKTARHTLPSLLYVPSIQTWWDLVDETARIVFISLMKGLDSSNNLLVLATIHMDAAKIPNEILELFDECHGEIYEIQSPGQPEKLAFFKQVLLKYQLKIGVILNEPSYVDFIQLMNQKNTKVEKTQQHNDKNTITTAAITKTPPEYPTSTICNSPSDTNIKTTKRKRCITTDNSSTLKRPRLRSDTALDNEIKLSSSLTDIQIEQLLKRIIERTENWDTQNILSLYNTLKIICDKNQVNTYTQISSTIDNLLNIINNKS